MIAAFRKAITAALPAETNLETYLAGMQPQDWTPVAELFAAKLPEFDLVICTQNDLDLARPVAQARGVPVLTTLQDERGRPTLTVPAGVSGEALLLVKHLQDGQLEADIVAQAKQAGLSVPLVGAAIERTTQGARTQLEAQGVSVRAVLQLADTPDGLVFERRTQDRWTL